MPSQETSGASPPQGLLHSSRIALACRKRTRGQSLACFKVNSPHLPKVDTERNPSLAESGHEHNGLLVIEGNIHKQPSFHNHPEHPPFPQLWTYLIKRVIH